VTTASTEGDALESTRDYERGILGCAVRDWDCAQKLMRLPPQVFTDPVHKLIVAEAVSQWGFDQQVVPPRIAKALEGKLPDDCNPHLYLCECASDENLATVAHFDAYCAELLKASRKRQLYAIGDGVCEAALNGRLPDDIYRQLIADIEDYSRQATTDEPRYRLISAAELDSSTYSQEYLIENVLIAGEPGVIGGAEKTLKTSIMLDMFIALSAGGHFLGTFPVNRPCRVLMFSGESGLPTLQETARRICQRAGYTLGELSDFTLSPDLPQLDNAMDMAECERVIINTGAEVVGVDPMMLCLGDADADAGNMFAIGKLLGGLAVICQRNNATLLIAHHTRGNLTAGAPPKLSDLAWAGFKQFARQWVLLSRREEYVPGTGDHRLWMVTGGSAGHNLVRAIDISEGTRNDIGGRHWGVHATNPTEADRAAKQRTDAQRAARQAEQLDDDKRAIIQAAAQCPGGEGTKSELRDRAGVRSERFNVALARLLADGDLEPTRIKRANGQEYDSYKLKVTP
jgi:hypothetical protein